MLRLRFAGAPIRARWMLALACAATMGLAGCTSSQVVTFQKDLTAFSAGVAKYAPIVGKDLVMIGQDLVLFECSPIASAASSAVANIISLTVSNQAAATRATNTLVTNTAVAAQLCPLYQSIKASIGAIPAGIPIASIPSST